MRLDVSYSFSTGPLPVQEVIHMEIVHHTELFFLSISRQELINQYCHELFTKFSISSDFFPRDIPSEIPLRTATSKNRAEAENSAQNTNQYHNFPYTNTPVTFSLFQFNHHWIDSNILLEVPST